MDTRRRSRIVGKAISVRGNDIDTDRIIPARFVKSVLFDGLGEHVFADERQERRVAGGLHPFDDPRFADARILIVNKNFGCGSSREHAPQAIMRWGKGIQAIVGESFSNIFFGNCLANGVLAATVDGGVAQRLMAANEGDPDREFYIDLETMTVSFPGESHLISMPPGPRRQLVMGAWDTEAELLSARAEIMATAARIPYFNDWRLAADKTGGQQQAIAAMYRERS